MNAKQITRNELAALVTDCVSAGVQVIAPAKIAPGRKEIAYRPVKSLDELSAEPLLPSRSLKEFYFPPTEPLLHFTQKKNDVELKEISAAFPQRLILGAKPCDAAALPVLDHVMNWDYHDEPWFGRRDTATVISFACPGVDRSCFCTSVGLSPDSTKGADLLFVPTSPDAYHIEVVTPKGEAFISAHAKHFTDAKDAAAADAYRKTAHDKIAANLDASTDVLFDWLKSNFDEGYWNGLAMRCHGCGACASVCPTCHCFDIVDELEGIGTGTRRRNWDTCQTSKFTIHASGHNPRNDQNARIRQRVMHKFFIYPEKFKEVLCTGCGRCARVCPGGMDLPEILSQIMGKAKAGETKRDAV